MSQKTRNGSSFSLGCIKITPLCPGCAKFSKSLQCLGYTPTSTQWWYDTLTKIAVQCKADSGLSSLCHGSVYIFIALLLLLLLLDERADSKLIMH